MKNKNCGQGAVEYLMTYGWAVLVVMVIGVALWQLGIFGLQGSTSTTATGFGRIKPMLPMVTMNSTGGFSGDFVNGAGGPIRVNSPIIAVAGDYPCTITVPTGDINNVDRLVLQGTCPGVSGKTGDPYEIDITITYNISFATSRVTHTDRGRIRGPIE